MFEYHQDPVTGRWIVTLDREQDITDFETKQEAIEYCLLNNLPQ